MKAQQFHAISADGKVIKQYIVCKENEEEARKCAHEKLKFNFPNTYHFIELKFNREIEI